MEGDANRKILITSYHTDGVHIGNSGASNLVIKGGKVGIGTDNPSANLNIHAASTSTLGLSSSWSGGTQRIAFTGGSPGGDGTAHGSTAASIDVISTAPGGAATGSMAFIINKGDALITGMKIHEYGHTEIFADSQGWATFKHGILNKHIRHVSTSASASNINLIRIRRHYWGGGHVKITLRQTYYSTVAESTWTITGHGRGDGTYTPNYNKSYNAVVGDMGSGRINLTTPSASSPGSSDAYFIDVSVNVTSYNQFQVIIEADANNVSWSRSVTSMGNDSYALHNT
jgi:hypothetical protein